MSVLRTAGSRWVLTAEECPFRHDGGNAARAERVSARVVHRRRRGRRAGRARDDHPLAGLQDIGSSQAVRVGQCSGVDPEAISDAGQAIAVADRVRPGRCRSGRRFGGRRGGLNLSIRNDQCLADG